MPFFILWVLSLCWILNANLPQFQTDALINLYNSTGGEQWLHRSNWLILDPCINHWFGVSCSLNVVLALILESNQLSGTIPPTIGNLSALQYLDLGFNQLRGGTIPPTIGNLSALTHLDLRFNQLSGTIPSTIGYLSALTHLDLFGNPLSGTIPPTIGNLSALQYLGLDQNYLSGIIPSTIGYLSALTHLDLSGNRLLSGTIPSTIGYLSALTYLGLYGNQLSGTIPPTIGYISTLQVLFLNGNQLSGTIPSTIGYLTAVTRLDLSINQLSGTIPSTIGYISTLKLLDLFENQLSGTIPTTIGYLSTLISIDLSVNQLSGTIPSTIGSLPLKFLDLSGNQLSGTIPSTIGYISTLQELNLGFNQLSGTIPSTIGYLSGLTYLKLSDNNFCGGCFPFSSTAVPYSCDVSGIPFNCSCPYQPCNSECNPDFMCQVPIPTTLYFWIIIIVLSIIALISIIIFVFSYIRHFLRDYDPIPYLTLQNPINTDVLDVSSLNRFVFNGDEIETEDFYEPCQALAPLILLQNNEQPSSFKESIAIAYGDNFNELFVDSNIEYGSKIYSSLCLSEKDFNMTLEEMLAIYFFALEWFNPTMNLYSRLNKDLTSKDRQISVRKWRFYVHYLFEGLRKIPYWKGIQDLYRAVSLDLISLYPQTYVQGNEIMWFSITSTTTNVKTYQQFIDNNTSGCTIFSINSTFSGRSISKFSSFPNECEILFPPGSRFKIIGILPIGPVNMIQLKQIPTLEKMLRLED